MGTNSRYGADLSGRVDPNPVALDTQLPPLSSTESLLGSHIALRSIANIGNTAGLLLSGLVPPTWTRYVDLTALSGASFLKHDRFELKYSGSAVFVPSSLPGAPTEGEFVYTTAGHQFQFWNGTAWVGLSSGSTGVASVTGTTNQVTVSPITGNVIASLPNDGTLPGTWNAQTGFNVLVGPLLVGTSPQLTLIGQSLGTVSAHHLRLRAGGTDRWEVDATTGTMRAITDNSYDFGASAATRARTGYFGTSLVVGADTTLSNQNLGQITNTATMQLAGGTGGGSGNLILFGGTHATTPNEIRLRQGTAVIWSVATGTGHWLAGTDNTYDIGATGATRPRSGYFGSSVVVGADPGGGGALRATGGLNITANIFQTGTSVEQDHKRTDAAVDSKTWNWFPTTTTFNGRILDDARVSGTNWLVVTRATMAITSVAFPNGAVIIGTDPNGSAPLRVGGNAKFGLVAGDLSIFCSSAAATTRAFFFQTASVSRWALRANSVAEGGSNAGSNFEIAAYDDAATFIDNPMSIVRAAGGTIQFNRDVTLAARLLFTTAVGKIVPGATSLSLRNNADSANNLLLTDAGIATLRNDLILGTLGQFDSTDTPLDGHILLYHGGGTNKWQAEAFQLIYDAGDSKVQVNADSTSVAFVYLDPGTGADSPVGAPPAPVIKLFKSHKAITIGVYASTVPDIDYHDGASFPADFRHLIYEYSIDNFVTPLALCTATSDKVVHGRLTSGTTYYYRVRAVDKFGNASANSTVVSVAATATSDTSAFGIILASEISVDRLSAFSANIGIMTSGQIRNAGNTSGINFGGAGGIPGTWTSGINFEAAAGSGSMTRYLNFTATGANPFIKHDLLSLNADGSASFSGTIVGAASLFTVTNLVPTSSTVANSMFSNITSAGALTDWSMLKLGVNTVDGTGSVTDMSVLEFGNQGQADTITDFRMIYMRNQILNASGTITNQYGLYVSSLTVGTNNYAIYTNSGLVRVGDDIVMGPAASRLRGGATSFALRNNANGADNILVADGGGVTFRAGLSGITTLALTGAQSGGTTLSLAGPITLTTAASKLIPGATSISLRNNADSADNILISDGGAVTVRDSLNISPAVNHAAGVELGYTGGSATTPFIDFHSGATAVDYDSRLIASGGTGVTAGGTLKADAATFEVTGTLSAVSGLHISGGGALLVSNSQSAAYGAPTGTATRTTFATGTVTLIVLAEHVKALIDDLKSLHGLLG